MCGRYYVDDATAREIMRIVRRVNEKLSVEAGDIYPSGEAPVIYTGSENAETMDPAQPAGSANLAAAPLAGTNAGVPPADIWPRLLSADIMQWGFPNFRSSGVIFNARSETVLEKRMFRDSVLHRRCIVPATAFYEWDRHKDKITFRRPDAPVMFMAGFYNHFANAQKNRTADGSRYVILTTGANDCVSPIHERMPIILDEHELMDWMLDDRSVEFMLHKKPGPLVWHKEYEQQTLKL